jgi:ATP-dependent DNA ligase
MRDRIIMKQHIQRGLEGIVAKRRDRPYRSGRSPDWIKVKDPAAPAATRLIGRAKVTKRPQIGLNDARTYVHEI